VLLLSTRASNYSIIKKATFWLKSVYIRFHNRPCYHWIVQSEMVKKLLKRHWGIDINKILVYPFFKEHFFKSNSIRKIDYLFVADGVPQKNHNFLFSTWELLATKYKFFPTLYTTINELRYTELSVKIKELKGKGINVVNIGTVSNDQLINLYQQTKYLIFPSLAESFGLPLIEASMVGCKVLASDLEYVDQVIDASALFDPKNSLELAELIHGIETNKINLPATNFKIKNKVVDILNHLKQYEYIQG
jgi:glycosyltransferase involved in cell wall biosynthesis